jgi:hypothetical protein
VRALILLGGAFSVGGAWCAIDGLARRFERAMNQLERSLATKHQRG